MLLLLPLLLQTKYALPGAPGVYIDLSSEDDLQEMWEEWDEYCKSMPNTANGMARLQLYVDTTGGSGRSSGSSDVSNSRYMAGSSSGMSSSGSGNSTTSSRSMQRSKSLKGPWGAGAGALQLQLSGDLASNDSATLAQTVALLSAQLSALSGARLGGYDAEPSGWQRAGSSTSRQLSSTSCPGSPTARAAAKQAYFNNSTEGRSVAKAGRTSWDGCAHSAMILSDMDGEDGAGPTNEAALAAMAAAEKATISIVNSEGSARSGGQRETDVQALVRQLQLRTHREGTRAPAEGKSSHQAYGHVLHIPARRLLLAA